MGDMQSAARHLELRSSKVFPAVGSLSIRGFDNKKGVSESSRLFFSNSFLRGSGFVALR